MPSSTGKTQRRKSLTRSAASSVWIRSPLPVTWISPSRSRLSPATASAASPSSRAEFRQSTDRSVREATNFGIALSLVAIGSSSGTRGQCSAKSS